jgi:hypothetical protein
MEWNTRDEKGMEKGMELKDRPLFVIFRQIMKGFNLG